MSITSQFQSTLPVWGGTPVFCRLPATRWRFNPPSPCGEGPGSISAGDLFSTVSIHPPRVGRDSRRVRPHPDGSSISIHPPRVGRDGSCLWTSPTTWSFQSTLPVWGGTKSSCMPACALVFQSTLPVWGGTSFSRCQKKKAEFQSTLPVWGGTA